MHPAAPPLLEINDVLTRYGLIDAVLTSLGWDTSDLSRVIPELPTATGRPDYCLMHQGNCLAVAEARSLRTDLATTGQKHFSYC